MGLVRHPGRLSSLCFLFQGVAAEEQFQICALQLQYVKGIHFWGTEYLNLEACLSTEGNSQFVRDVGIYLQVQSALQGKSILLFRRRLLEHLHKRCLVIAEQLEMVFNLSYPRY